MPRGSFKHEDASQGFGFQEGNFEVTKSVIAVHQFPPNQKTGRQSDPFTAMRWTGYKLDENWARAEDEQIVIPIRMGAPADLRPGHLNPKDAANLDVEPEDLGKDVDTEGNALFCDPDKKVFGSWPEMEASLRKCGFKADISGRGFAPDFEGMKLHMKTVGTGRQYEEKGTGEKKEATTLVCDRIQTYPYEVKKGATKAATKPETKAVSKPSAPATEASGSDPKSIVIAVLGNLSDKFKEIVAPGKEVKRGVFQMQFMTELMRQKVQPVSGHKAMLDLLKDDDGLVEIAGESGFMVDLEKAVVIFPEA